MTREDEAPDAADASATDDDALQWAGDEELGRDSTPGGAHRDAVIAAAVLSVDDDAPRTGRAGFVIAAIVALISAVGWGIVVAVNPVAQDTLLALAFYQFGEFLAVVTPLLAVIVVQRITALGARSKLLWWIVGLVVTAPWPLLAGVGA